MKNQNEQKKARWIDGRMIQGEYLQWIREEHPEARKYLLVIDIILQYTFQQRKRSEHIRSNKFTKYMSASTKKRHIKALRDMGLLSYKRTRFNEGFALTNYELTISDYIKSRAIFEKKSQVIDRATGKEVVPIEPVSYAL